MLLDNKSVFKIFLVAVCLCLVCSFVVAATAVGLRGAIRANKERYRMRNVLSVAGFDAAAIRQGGGVEAVFKNNIEVLYIHLDSGEEAAEQLAKLMEIPVGELGFRFDPVKLAKSPPEKKLSTPFARSADNEAGLIGGRENYAAVYLKKNAAGNVEKYIFPIRGVGLWSTLYGFIALEPDLQTVSGLTFYEHGETPGLGGEVENEAWKQSWIGKKVYAVDEQSGVKQDEVKLRVVKGVADQGDPYGINGLSGATITSNGVTNLIHFWMGQRGYGKFIARERQRLAAAANTQGAEQ